MTYLLPPDGRSTRHLLYSDGICKPTQRSQNQIVGSPALRAFGGEEIVLRYQENGHITLSNNNLSGKRTPRVISIYGTARLYRMIRSRCPLW